LEPEPHLDTVLEYYDRVWWPVFGLFCLISFSVIANSLQLALLEDREPFGESHAALLTMMKSQFVHEPDVEEVTASVFSFLQEKSAEQTRFHIEFGVLIAAVLGSTLYYLKCMKGSGRVETADKPRPDRL
jgi:hypothetical protein